MHVLTDNEMQRFVRATGVVGALLLVAGILGLGLWAVSLGGLLLVLAGLVVLAAVEGRELDETPAAAAIGQPVAAGRTMSAADDEPTDAEGASPSSEPAVADVSPPEPAKATLSPLERLAMALLPGALPDRRPVPSRKTTSSPVSDRTPPPRSTEVTSPDPVPDPGDAPAERSAPPSPASPATAPPVSVPDPGGPHGDQPPSVTRPDRAPAASAPVDEPPEPAAVPDEPPSVATPPPAAASAVPPQVVELRDDASEEAERPSTSPAVGQPSVEPTDEPGPEPAVVTFRLPRSVGAQAATVVGDFNGWSPDAHPMAREDDAFVARIPLEPGRAYRYRYLLDGERWENDWAADGYVPNEYGGDDSLIDLRR